MAAELATWVRSPQSLRGRVDFAPGGPVTDARPDLLQPEWIAARVVQAGSRLAAVSKGRIAQG